MPAQPGPESRHLLEKLIREVARAEAQAIDHPVREARRIGDVPPVEALRDVGAHATAMRTRFAEVLQRHDLPLHKGSLAATLATLRHLVVDRVIDAERAYRTAALDLRHGVEAVQLLRDAARREEVFALIRWCDDWLRARRTLVARVDAQLPWFAEQTALALGLLALPPGAGDPFHDDADDDADAGDDFDVLSSAGDPENRPGSSRFRDRT